ncbi:MAG: hypothetical protein N2044_12255 [Cyclobacteriaceae bacterium]|nr:hypothetical protein [Cyclobacteriaceae bacterium]MCX7638609.1 hypothetical protein [Cyclobacteriaceae bacterium]MDW8330741.1 hypothetical protein [Cyclobacteriaceae bacterium]
MNKYIWKIALLISPLVLVSCGDDEEEIKPAPTLSVTGAPISALPGDAISFQVTVTAPNGGDRLNAFVGTTSIASIDLGGETTSTQTINYTIPPTAVIGSTVTITLQATDKKNLPSTISIVSIQVNDPVIQLGPGPLTSRTLDANKRYLIKGQTFIPNGVTVTIPAGTVIFGDKATKGTLVVEKGGTLNCNGTATNPVVMTSAQNVGERDKGDWGGLVILGRAFTNQNTSADDSGSPSVEGIDPPKRFGSNVRTNDGESSGTYRYLRVEYAGIELTPNNETNSITMGGVGSGTIMEYIQVSFGGDDGFEWFGGTVNGKYLVSLSTWDDDFDGDYGWSGKVQFGLVVRNPFYADQSQSNAFELDNGPNDTDTGAGTYTTAIFSNITVYGPRDNAGRTISANNVHCIDLRRRVAASIFNSVIVGFPTGLRFNQPSVLSQYTGGTGVLANNVLSANTQYAAGTGVNVADVQSYWEATARNNSTLTMPASGSETTFWENLGLRVDNFFARYTTATYPSNPNFTLSSGTATIATGASFTDGKFTGDTFFTKTVTYRGAFGSTDWTDNWTEFRPISKAY